MAAEIAISIALIIMAFLGFGFAAYLHRRNTAEANHLAAMNDLIRRPGESNRALLRRIVRTKRYPVLVRGPFR